jgi:solute carrier family 26 (sodium-independent sulfate anion transporter), member 11
MVSDPGFETSIDTFPCILGSTPFNLTGDVASGLPSITLPPFSTTFEGVYYNFIDMIRTLGLSTFSLPLISIIEAIAIAKSFNRGKTLDVTQEMIALGLCNLLSAFFQSIPITGSFTRSAVNNASGVKTPAGGITTGLVVLLALGVLTQTFEYIPKASLAAVIIAAMFMMMNFREVLVIWKTKRIDLLPFLGTFVMSLIYGLDIGILVGVGIDIAMTVYRMSRPVMNMEVLDRCLVVRPKLSINYSSAEYVKEKVIRFLNLNTHIRHVVIDGSIFSGIDLTAVKILNSLVDDCEFIGIGTYFWNWSSEARNAMMRFDKKKFSEICKNGDDVKDFVENVKNYDAKVIYI